VSYQPKGEDLDYPGKLQRRAAAAAEGAAPPVPPAAGELPNAALDDPEVRVCVIHYPNATRRLLCMLACSRCF